MKTLGRGHVHRARTLWIIRHYKRLPAFGSWLSLQDVGPIIEANGFVTVSETRLRSRRHGPRNG